jgi:hypothetical protein
LVNLKGRNLLGEVLGDGQGTGGKVAGVEELKIESGELIIRLAE